MTSAQAVSVLHRLRQVVHVGADAASDAQLLARYTIQEDEAAFAGLVARHGPMVLGVCRSVLHNHHDAEDAFQATFLVLARSPGSIRKEESLASFLHGVAYRVALRARTSAARQRARERRTAEASPADPLLDMTLREVREILHEELHQLPEKYRAPLVLCYLEGLSQEEAARQLGWSAGATRGRLDRGRDHLRRRLARRGLTLSAVLGTISLGAVPVPAALLGSVSANASALAEGVIHAMFASKMKTLGLVLLLAVMVSAGTGWLLHNALAGRESRDRAKTNEASKDEKGGTVFAGRVLDPDGKPVPGARLYVTHHDDKLTGAPKPLAVTGTAGRFRFTVPAASEDEGKPSLFAAADGFGPAWVVWPAPTGEITLRLAKDDVAVTGRILNLEGRPVAGVRVTVLTLKYPRAGSLSPWLEAVKTHTNADGIRLDYDYLPMFNSRELSGLFPSRTTGADGRFTLRGIGRERGATLVIEGPTIETKEINVLTRPGVPTITVPWYRTDPEGGDFVYYAARFDHIAAPCRPVSGVVRDRATGKPLAGATVRAKRAVGNLFKQIQARTDRAGRYRLTGLPGGRARLGLDTLVALPPEGQAYVSAQKRLEGRSRIEPDRLDFELERGVWIEGQVTNQVTGEGVEAQLQYYLFQGERPEAELRAVYLPDHLYTDRQGRFRFVGVPGRALLGARSWGAKANQFRTGLGADRIEGREVLDGWRGGFSFRTLPDWAMSINFDVLAEVKPAKGAQKVTCLLKLDPGSSRTVRVLDPDGKPLAGARVVGQFARQGFGEPLPKAEFTVHALRAGEPRGLLFQHDGKKLAGRLLLKGDERGRVEVRLQKAAALSGRLLDSEGRPLRHLDMTVFYEIESEKNVLAMHRPGRVPTDAEGRFRVGGLTPGIRYRGDVWLKGKPYPGVVFDLSPKEGESRDLGDVKPRTRNE
jgi:RNA polymerase sigma factor (sigma-70 family)